MTPWWQAVDEAVEKLVAALTSAATRAARRAERRRGRRRRTGPKGHGPGIRRQLADVIRARRLAVGLAVDHKTVSALFTGHRGLVTNPALVVAVARACAIIAERKLTAKEADRLRAASLRIGRLIARAEDADRIAAVPPPPPAPVVEPGAIVVLQEPIDVPATAPEPVAEPAPDYKPTPVTVPVPARGRRPARRVLAAAVVLAVLVVLVLIVMAALWWR